MMGGQVQRMSAVTVVGLVLIVACAASFPVEVSGAHDDLADASHTTAALSRDGNRDYVGKTPVTPSYRAAVVEHAPISVPGLVTRTEALKVMMENLDVYEAHLHNASAAQQLDIIVYPEDGLFGDDKCQRDEIYPYLERIPENRLPSQPLFNPCEQAATELFQDTPVLVRLSCLARTYSTAVVADMGDVQPCSLSNDPFCPRDGRYQFNTQVAFDNDGTLLAKYHKTHLFYEPQYDAPRHPSPVTFTTSFGVRFGMVVCFDLMFPLPPVDLVRELQVQDIVYSTWWINTPPSFSATQYQQAWSRSLGVNLLAAGNGNAWLYSGSGIFSRGDTLAELYNIYYTGHDSVGVADVPILSGAPQERSAVSQPLARRIPAALPNGIAPMRQSRATERAWMERQAHRGGVEQFEVHCPADGATNGDVGYAPAWREVYEEALSTGKVHMHAGRQMKASATALHLTCTAQLNASAIQPYIKNDSDSEWYVVFAFAGQYDNETMFYREHFCATFRCFNETTCLYDLIFANTIFSGFELTATMPQGHTMFTLTATNNAALIPNSYIKSGWKMGAPSRPEYYVKSHRDGGDRDFGYILLNASLLARDMRNL